MPPALRDLRAKISEETDQVLTAVAMHRGIDKAEVVRDVLAEWAKARLHEARLIVRFAPREGGVGKEQ